MAKQKKESQQPVTGIESLQAAVEHITGESVKISGGTNWQQDTNKHLQQHGWKLENEKADVSVQAPHIGVFYRDGQLQAVVLERDEIISNPTQKTVIASQLSSRIRVSSIDKDGDDNSENGQA